MVAHPVTVGHHRTERAWMLPAATSLPSAPVGHGGLAIHAAFSPDGARIVTTSEDGTARVYRAFRNRTELITFTKSRLTRGLTPAQRIANYLDLPDAMRADHNSPTSATRYASLTEKPMT